MPRQLVGRCRVFLQHHGRLGSWERNKKALQFIIPYVYAMYAGGIVEFSGLEGFYITKRLWHAVRVIGHRKPHGMNRWFMHERSWGAPPSTASGSRQHTMSMPKSLLSTVNRVDTVIKASFSMLQKLIVCSRHGSSGWCKRRINNFLRVLSGREPTPKRLQAPSWTIKVGRGNDGSGMECLEINREI